MRLVLMMLCNLSAGADSAHYSNVGHMLSAACWTESSSGSSFHWIVLFENAEDISVETSLMAGKAECAYQFMSIEFMPRWNFSQKLASTDYKVITIRLPAVTIRESFKIYVSISVGI